MASSLLKMIRDRFHNGVKKEAASKIGVKQACYQHFDKGRSVKDWMITHIRRLYGIKNNPNGFTDTQLLDALEKDYPPKKLKEILREYK